jgi:predicted MFS family arabinose efflux permease
MTGDPPEIFHPSLAKHKFVAQADPVHALKGSLGAVRDVFRNPNLRRLQFAWIGSIAGQYSYSIALAIFAYRHGGAAAVGVIALIRTVPAAVLGPFVSGLGDKFPRERVMLGADLTRAVLVGAIAIVTFAHLPWTVVFAIAAFGPICGMAFQPAQASLLPSLARTPEELSAANVSSSTIESVGAFAGPAIGGVVLATWGVGAAFTLTAVTYLWSAMMVARLDVQSEAAVTQAADEQAATHEGFFAGFRAIAATKGLRVIVLLYAAQTVVAGAMGVLVVVAALRLLSLGSGGVGWLYSACGVGGVIGALVALALVGRQRLATDFGIGLLLWGLPFIVLGFWPNTVVALVMLGVLGVGNTLVDVSALTLLQRNTDERVRSRVFGVIESAITGTIGLGAIIAPLLIGLFGIRAALVATGLFLPVVTGFLWRQLLALDTSPVARRGIELLRGIPIFAPLPPASIERLAEALAPVELAAGTVLFRSGDAGDRFYVVASGELAVDLPAGEKLEGPGGWVGEIALLRAIPRTATVRAHTDVELLALDREVFLDAVTGHDRASQAANFIVGERLALSPV